MNQSESMPSTRCWAQSPAPVSSSAIAGWWLRRAAHPQRAGWRLAIGWAPEHPFPAALDDAVAAWRYLRERDIAAGHIAVGGDSAGGNLTALDETLLDDASRFGSATGAAAAALASAGALIRRHLPAVIDS